MPPPADPHGPLPPGQRGIVTLALSVTTFMQVLDSSIANVAIPAIAGDLGASPTQGTWVITAFAVSQAITLPLSGWLARRFGELRVLILAILLFTLASWGCGLAANLPLLVLFRVVQGAVAGPMIPLAQTFLVGIHPPEARASAFATWSMTTLVAPIAGPIVGGWITDNASWPWIFYVNVPVGLTCGIVLWRRLRGRESPTTKTPIDAIGLAMLVLGIGSLQMMLDLGKELDWFESPHIVTLAIVAAVSLSVLIVWELADPHPVVDLRLFAQRNFGVGAFATSVAYMMFFGSVVVLPLWLQTRMGYTPTVAGLVTSPTGLVALLVTPLLGRVMRRLDPRVIVSFAFCVFAATAFWRSTLDTDATAWQIAAPQFLQGLATACFFVPLVGITLSRVPPARMASGSGLSNFSRILAGSFGASLSTTLWERRAALHHAQLVEEMTPGNTLTLQALDTYRAAGLEGDSALAMLDRLVDGQSYMLATNDIYWVAAWCFVVLIPLPWLARPPFMGQLPAAGD
jgi:DHA2 family multidrug resistance protein